MYSNPHHNVGCTDGEVRQQYANTFIGRPVSGEPTINDEADAVAFIAPPEVDVYDIHPGVRHQIGDFLSGSDPHLC